MRTLKKEEEVGKFVPQEKRSRKEEGTNEGITGAGRENHGEKCVVNTFTQEERERSQEAQTQFSVSPRCHRIGDSHFSGENRQTF